MTEHLYSTCSHETQSKAKQSRSKKAACVRGGVAYFIIGSLNFGFGLLSCPEGLCNGRCRQRGATQESRTSRHGKPYTTNHPPARRAFSSHSCVAAHFCRLGRETRRGEMIQNEGTTRFRFVLPLSVLSFWNQPMGVRTYKYHF